MAQTYGSSGAWQEICKKLEAIQLRANQPKDIETLLEACIKEYARQLRMFLDTAEDEITLLEQEITREKIKTQADLATYMETFSLDLEQSEATLDFYRNDHSIFNIFRNSFRIRLEKKKLDHLQKSMQEYRDEIEKPLHEKEGSLEQKKTHKNQLAREHCSEIDAQINFLKTLSGSQELASAQAELEMLQYLQSLPDNVHIFNNLKLKVDRGFRIQGNWLIRSQIDHLVISPAGLFAIDVKNWSKQQAEKSTKLSTGEQIKEAAQLCHLLLKPDFPGITVRPILAYRGHIPESENTGFVKVLPIQEVCGYINWFTETPLDSGRMQEIVTCLQNLSNQENKE